MALAGCTASPAVPSYTRTRFNGSLFYQAPDRSLHALTCGAEFRVIESPRKVTIVFAEEDFPPGMAAFAGVGASCRVYDFVLRLREALGNRPVIDGVSGETLPVQPWSAQGPVAPETPAPSLPAGQ